MFSHISVIFHFYWERWNSSEFVTNLMMGFSWSLKSYLSIVCILSSTIYLHVLDVVNNMIGNVMWSIIWLLMWGRQLNYMLLINWTHFGWFKRDLKLELMINDMQITVVFFRALLLNFLKSKSDSCVSHTSFYLSTWLGLIYTLRVTICFLTRCCMGQVMITYSKFVRCCTVHTLLKDLHDFY